MNYRLRCFEEHGGLRYPLCMGRISSKTVVDFALLLDALDKASPIYGPKKLQQIIFLVELRLKEKGLAGPHFPFVQSDQGPYSKELWNALEELSARGFIDTSDMDLTHRENSFSILSFLSCEQFRKTRQSSRV